MRHLEIIAKIKQIGAISEDRKQTIFLEDVAICSGAFFEGETTKIYICDSAAAKVIDETLKQYKE